ncbi:MAG: acyltransferase family protein [Curtobacterium sp.]
MQRTEHTFRRDIEGLRAWAVAGVVVFHLFGVPFGGVAGVDVFFVISGFLITGSLLREYERTGRISFGAFALRRVQRLLPAAVPVLVVTVIAAFFVWFLPRAIEIALDGLAAATSVANWHFALRTTDYFSGESSASPLQHFWSLSVEEQFYAVWPVVVLVALAVVARLSRPFARRAVLLVIVLAVIAGGLAYALWQTDADPNRAYFDTLARSWELGLGALAAVVQPWLRRAPRKVAVVLSAVGLTGIVMAMLVTDPDVAFPAPGALPAVLGATLVVGFGWSIGGRGPLAWVIASAPLRVVGRLSYSIYLWHFPVHVFLRATLGAGALTAIVALVTTLLLAWASYRFVEAPTLRWAWPTMAAAGWLRRAPDRRRRAVEGVVAATVVAVLVGAAGAQRLPDLKYPGGVLQTFGVSSEASVTPSVRLGSTDEAQRAVREALARSSWSMPVTSQLNRTVADIERDLRECLNLIDSDLSNARSCTAGPATAERVAVVVGDSTAAAYSPGVEQALVPLGWRVETMTFAGCSVLGRANDPHGHGHGREAASAHACGLARDQMVRFADAQGADLVIASASGQAFAHDVSQRVRADRWQQSTAEGLADLAAPGRTVVSLTAPPNRERITSCAIRSVGPSSCETDASGGPNTDRDAKIAAERAAVVDVAERGMAVHQLDVSDWFCTDGRCPAVIDDTIVMYDEKHITPSVSAALAGPMREVLSPYLR